MKFFQKFNVKNKFKNILKSVRGGGVQTIIITSYEESQLFYEYF